MTSSDYYYSSLILNLFFLTVCRGRGGPRGWRPGGRSRCRRGDLLVGEDPEVEAAEEAGEVCDGMVGVVEVIDPHLTAKGGTVFFEGGGRGEAARG